MKFYYVYSFVPKIFVDHRLIGNNNTPVYAILKLRPLSVCPMSVGVVFNINGTVDGMHTIRGDYLRSRSLTA